MIRNDREYKEMLQRLEQDKQFIDEQLASLRGLGLDEGQVSRAMEPAYSFHEQLREEVEYYEKIKRGEFETITNFAGLGRLLIASRIAKGISQRELAQRLEVSEAQVSRDERNEYHGLTVERAMRILNALGVTLVSEVRMSDSTHPDDDAKLA